MLKTNYSINALDINFSLNFKSNLTLIDGLSGTGKTMLFKQIRKDSVVNTTKKIACFNYENKGDASAQIHKLKGYIIFIDNAEIILNADDREYVSRDKNNQYVIFTHTTAGFYPQEGSFTKLRIENAKGYLDYVLL